MSVFYKQNHLTLFVCFPFRVFVLLKASVHRVMSRWKMQAEASSLSPLVCLVETCDKVCLVSLVGWEAAAAAWS